MNDGVFPMHFVAAPLTGVFVLELEKHEDERGYFARSFCREEFLAQGLSPDISQCSISYNRLEGTLRGLHWQITPNEEIKLVRCIRGKVFDVVVDLRPVSSMYGKYFALELSEENSKAIYIPEGLAHGFLSLQDDSILLYQISRAYVPESARTIRWDDPILSIPWPRTKNLIMSEKDRTAPLWDVYHKNFVR